MSKIIKPLPLIAVYAVIIYFSLRTPPHHELSITNMDKIGHFIAYFTLSLTIFISISNRIIRTIFTILSFTLGITLEIIQGKTGYREMSIADGLANTIGLLAGIVFFIVFERQIVYILKKLRLNKIFLSKE